jgi:hypothetical protein
LCHSFSSTHAAAKVGDLFYHTMPLEAKDAHARIARLSDKR